MKCLLERANQRSGIVTQALEAIDWAKQDFRLVQALDAIEARAGEFPDEQRALVIQDVTEWRKHWDFYVRGHLGGSRSIQEFLSQVALGTTQQPSEEGVALLTIHSAKGMEFEVVFVIGMNEGTFPDFRARGSAMDEEQRNAFVAVTRSRRLLYLCYPQSKLMPWGDTRVQRRSRFLDMVKGD